MLLSNICTLLTLLSLSQAQDTTNSSASLSDLGSLFNFNLTDDQLAIQLSPTDLSAEADAVRPPPDPHAARYPEYTLWYNKYKAPYAPVEKAQGFLMFCMATLSTKLFEIAITTKGRTVPGTRWPLYCANHRSYPGLELTLSSSSRETYSTVPLSYIPTLLYGMFRFDELWEPGSGYSATANSSATEGLGRGGIAGGVPQFEAELNKKDGPAVVFAKFEVKPSYGSGSEGGNETVNGEQGGFKQGTGSTVQEITATS